MNSSPIHLLLVEDNPADALLLKHALAEAGGTSFRVTHVEQMADAERCLAGDDFDAILLDLSLPDSRGVDTVKRANAVAPRLPIVVMTGLDDEAAALEAVRTGAQDFLIKGSADGRLLARAIRYAMERKQAEQELKALNETLEQRVAERTATATRRAAQLQALASELTLTEQRERRRLADILHDQLQQLIYAARLNLGALRSRVRDADSQEIIRKIDDLLAQSLDQSRSLTVELSPPVLYEAGLAAALEWLGRYMEQTCGLVVEVQADPQAEPDGEDLHILLFQSVRELLFNVVKHGRTGLARVEMAAAPHGKVRLEVSDDGAGFDPAGLKAGHSAGGGFGLFSIRERLELLGGRLQVEASPGHGSRMAIFVPRRRSNAGAGPSRKGDRRLPRPAATSLQEPTP
jgi:signal transduction histidine kinase